MNGMLYAIAMIVYGFLMFYCGVMVGSTNAKSRVAETPDKDPRENAPEDGYKMAPTRNNPERGQ